MRAEETGRAPPRSWRVLSVVLKLDALASAAMPALLLGAVPLLATLDTPASLIGLLVLGYAVVLGAMGAVIAGILGRAMARGASEVPETTWFFLQASRRRTSTAGIPDGIETV